MRFTLARVLIALMICCLATCNSSVIILANDQCRSSLRMPPLFSDHMMLQQGMPVPIWGNATPGERVYVRFREQEISTVAKKDGAWMVHLEQLHASERPEVLTVAGQLKKLEFNDVLVGEVWLCSGQSNMEASFESLGIADQLQHVCNPGIRISNGTKWNQCDKESLLRFSCVGYYFGRKLEEKLDVPIGLINISQGSSSIEAWMTPTSIESNRELIDQDGHNLWSEMNRFEQFRSNYDSLAAADREQVFSEHCHSAYGFARQFLGVDGKVKIEKYKDILFHMQCVKPACLYRSRIAPAIPYGIRGAIWYQGETNVGDAQYARKQQVLIESWRKMWGQGDFPFYIVQVAPYRGYHMLPALWLQQYKAVEKTPNCGLALTVDVGDLDNFHPVNKRDIGVRLALLSLQNTYDMKDVIAAGPTYNSIKIDGKKILIEFDHAENGMITTDSLPPREFEVAGEDGKFIKVDALIQGNTIQLVSPLDNPQFVRYAWHCLATPNLCNKEGLPALPFNTAEPFFNGKANEVQEHHKKNRSH